MAKRVRWRRGRKDARQEIEELLRQPPRDPEHKQMRAWIKTEEQRYGRNHDGPYKDWLIQEFGPGAIADADDVWLTPTLPESD